MRLAFAGPTMQSEKAGQLLQTSKHQKPSNKHQTDPKSEPKCSKRRRPVRFEHSVFEHSDLFVLWCLVLGHCRYSGCYFSQSSRLSDVVVTLPSVARSFFMTVVSLATYSIVLRVASGAAVASSLAQ
jgi:hypothetical protein